MDEKNAQLLAKLQKQRNQNLKSEIQSLKDEIENLKKDHKNEIQTMKNENFEVIKQLRKAKDDLGTAEGKNWKLEQQMERIKVRENQVYCLPVYHIQYLIYRM